LSQAEERVGPPLHVDLEATLEDLYNGRTLTVTQKKQVLCHRCRGTGAENPDEVTKCPVCGGSGVRLITQQLGPGFITQTQTTYDLSLLLLPHPTSSSSSRIALHSNSAPAPAQLRQVRR
jgi:ribosomal protein L40E